MPAVELLSFLLVLVILSWPVWRPKTRQRARHRDAERESALARDRAATSALQDHYLAVNEGRVPPGPHPELERDASSVAASS